MAAEMTEKDVLLAQDTGLESQCVEEDVLGQGSRLSAADRRRNARLEQLRERVPVGGLVLGIDLAADKQHAVLCDHDSRVLARWKVTAKAWQLGPLLDRAVAAAARHGFASVTVACEPTGHRWQVLEALAAERGLPLVCIQPLVMRRAREQEDYTTEKTDAKDSVLIARLAARLHCYLPERLTEDWGLLRAAGTRREQLVTAQTAARQQARDLLECGWPAVLAAAPKCGFDSATWLACLHVVLSSCDGRPERLRRWTAEQFTAAVRGALGRFGGKRLRHTTVAAVYAALSDPAGRHPRRAGALVRAGWAVEDLAAASRRLAEAEAALTGLLDQLGLTELACSIPGLSPVGAAAILAETGDLTRFSHARAVVKHAGLAPRARESGQYTGTARLSGRGRPRLRLAAWRAVFGALRHNQALQDRYRHLTERADNPLSDGQARAALAATLLRWLHAIITQQRPYQTITTTGDLHTAA